MRSAYTWEEHYGWRDEYGEDTVGPYRDFIEPLTQLFERTALAFDHGEFTLARQAYRRLFDLAEREDNYGYCISLFNLTGLDQKKAIAYYLRAIYQTEAHPRAVPSLSGFSSQTPKRACPETIKSCGTTVQWAKAFFRPP